MKEHKVISWDGVGNSVNNPLNPHNGNLAVTLDDHAKNGWSLLSYDWGSWRTAVLVRTINKEVSR